MVKLPCASICMPPNPSNLAGGRERALRRGPEQPLRADRDPPPDAPGLAENLLQRVSMGAPALFVRHTHGQNSESQDCDATRSRPR
eukprot:15435390-Alexandrium_andersonii.AAC.1